MAENNFKQKMKCTLPHQGKCIDFKSCKSLSKFVLKTKDLLSLKK